MIHLTDILKELLLAEKQKADRCLRIARRKYSKHSAYRSGAIVRCRQGDIWKDLKEAVDPSEAYTAIDALQTVIDGKRSVAYIALTGSSLSQDKFRKLLTDNSMQAFKVPKKSDPTYIVFKRTPQAEKNALELLAIANKYGGYLHYKASKADAKRIGELLEYTPESIERYLQKIYNPDGTFKNLKEGNRHSGRFLQKVDQLPKGKLFDDAKNIEGIFTKSSRSWSEVAEAFEKGRDQAEQVVVNIEDIHITQPNIQANKVKHMLDKVNSLPPINVVEFEDGEKVIYDAHHRLITNWALGNDKIKVNLVKVKNLQEIERTTSLIGGNIDYNQFVDWAKSEADKITNKKESFANLEFQWAENSDGVKVIVYEKNVPLGYIGLGKFEDGYKINTLGVKDAARRKGLATKIYDYIISKTKLYSDKMQTPEARKLWVKLASKYNVKGYDKNTKKVFDVKPENGELKSVDPNFELYTNKVNSNYLVISPEAGSKNINEDESLHKWFSRQGGTGGSKGWVDCNTCRKDPDTGRKKCKSCGRQKGEKRSKYPSCRPTPSQCDMPGKGKKWGKTK